MLKKIIALSLATSLCACSSVDSTQPFNQQQAANLLHQNRTVTPMQHMIKLTLPKQPEWQRIDMSRGTVGTPIMLIPQGETATHWTESIRTYLLAFRDDRTIDANKLTQMMISEAKQHCQQVNATIFPEKNHTIIYHLELKNCAQHSNQLQWGKTMTGNDAIYLVYYTATSQQTNPHDINQLTTAITNAHLVASTNRIKHA